MVSFLFFFVESCVDKVLGNKKLARCGESLSHFTLHTHRDTHARTLVGTHTYTHTLTHIHTDTHTHTHTHTHKQRENFRSLLV